LFRLLKAKTISGNVRNFGDLVLDLLYRTVSQFTTIATDTYANACGHTDIRVYSGHTAGAVRRLAFNPDQKQRFVYVAH